MCTANSARSHLAAALWRRASQVPAASAGTHPAAAIDPGAIAAAGRHHLPLRRLRPRHIDEVHQDGDLVVTVCDLAREELGGLAAVHWSVPDPVPAGDPGSFDAALADLGQRVGRLAPRLVPPPRRRRLPAGERDPPAAGWPTARGEPDGREAAGTVRMNALDLAAACRSVTQAGQRLARAARSAASGADAASAAPAAAAAARITNSAG